MSRLFIDFDGTIAGSVKAICETYNYLYQNFADFKPADYRRIQCYNFKDVCPLVDDIKKLFEHPLFFRKLDFIDDNTYEVLETLNQKYNIIICSIGTPLNISKKVLWLEEKLPFIKNYVLIANNDCKMDKSIINTGKDSIFIDDIPSNLESVESERKILFGEKFSWNNFWEGEYCVTWSDVRERLL